MGGGEGTGCHGEGGGGCHGEGGESSSHGGNELMQMHIRPDSRCGSGSWARRNVKSSREW